jgi:elongation factor Ts
MKMTAITAALVKELREMTGAGMMDCKNALTENGGSIEASVDWLRAKGLSKAAKKSGRVAAEGLVGLKAEGTKGVVIELNSETDFVARNPEFQDLVRTVVGVAIASANDVETVKAAAYPGAGTTVAEKITALVGTIGENMTLRRSSLLEVSAGVVGTYMHNAISDGLGKIGVLVALESTGNRDELTALGRMIAMHVAATNPVALDASGVPDEVKTREMAILAEKNAGKPEHVLAKIMENGYKTFCKESCLIDQPYIHDGSKTVAQAVKEAESKVGAPISLKGFVRYGLGDGIEKEVSDFAAEVAAASGVK